MSKGLIDFAQFKTNTKHTKLKVEVRGSNIEAIDDLLIAWDSIPMNASDDLKMAHLARIISACKAWIRLKQAKKGAPNVGDTTEYARRYREIKSLGNQAVAELFRLDPDLGVAHASFATAKGLSNSPLSPATGMQARSMAPGYMNERTSYLDFNKSKAISGSKVHDALDSARDPNLRSMHGKTQLAKLDKANKASHGKTLDQLTAQEYQEIGRLADGSDNQGMQVKYFSKLERLKMLVAADGAGLLVDYQQATLNSGNNAWPYAIDVYGNVFFSRDVPPPGYARFNHSSFNAGNDVICAGTMRIQNGQLLSFNNNSGHYKPDRANLDNALVVLRDLLFADMSQAEVEFWVPDPPNQVIRIGIYTIHAFTHNGAPTQTHNMPM